MYPKILRHYWLVGLIYGFLLFIFAFIPAGGGHGTYLMFGCFSSPFAFFGIPFAIFGVLILWIVIGCLLMFIHRLVIEKIFLGVMCFHYIGMPFIILSEDYGNLVFLKRTWEVVPYCIVSGFIVYLVGQIGIWVIYVNRLIIMNRAKNRSTDGSVLF
jgi:hypothetical protein